MNGGTMLLLAFGFGTIVFVIQRTEAQRRRGVTIFMLLIVVGILWYVGMRQAWGEAVVGLIIALIVNLLFWMFIGRYNPVGSSDSIRVLGMDD
jgi:hypothetical protein